MAFRIPHLAACWAHEEASGSSACNVGPGIETFLNRRVSVSYIGRHEYEEEEEEEEENTRVERIRGFRGSSFGLVGKSHGRVSCCSQRGFFTFLGEKSGECAVM